MIQKQLQNQRNNFYFFSVILVGVLFFPASLFASSSDGTINANSYAWATKSGWINFSTTYGNVRINDGRLTGYIWSAKHGWINLSPPSGGVLNNSEGDLSGFAWGEQLGWIDFTNVSIDGNGRFRGSAQGEEIGTLTFECTTCSVVTDWRPYSLRAPLSSGGGSGDGKTQQQNTSIQLPITNTLEQTTSSTSSLPIPTPTTPIIPLLPIKTKEQILQEVGVIQSLQYGKNNNIQEVKKLQKFLRENEKMIAVKETGIFDKTTRDAVIKFQERYANDILKPNGLKKGTGVVSTGTIAVINRIVLETAQKNKQKEEIKKEIQPLLEKPAVWTTFKNLLEEFLIKMKGLLK